MEVHPDSFSVLSDTEHQTPDIGSCTCGSCPSMSMEGMADGINRSKTDRRSESIPGADGYGAGSFGAGDFSWPGRSVHQGQ
jgi:hypothetical protein